MMESLSNNRITSLSSIILEFGQIAVFDDFVGLIGRLSWGQSSWLAQTFLFVVSRLILLMGDSQDIPSIKVSDKRNSSLWFCDIQAFLELRILWLKKHGNFVAFLLLQVGLFLRAVWSGVAVLATNGTLYCGVALGLEGASPSSVTLLLAIFTIIVVNSLHL